MTLRPDSSSTPSNTDEPPTASGDEQDDLAADKDSSSFNGNNSSTTSTTKHAKTTTDCVRIGGVPYTHGDRSFDHDERFTDHDERSMWILKYRLAIGLADRILTSWGYTLRALLVLAAITFGLWLLR